MKAEGPDREGLLEPTRSRTAHTAGGQLPGGAGGTEKLARASGRVRSRCVLRAPFDEQWLIPDHRLIDAARPELWRVADERQVFVVEAPDAAGPPLLVATSRLPLLGGPRVRPLYRRPDGAEPNLAPGLLDHLAARPGRRPTPEDVLAWAVATVRSGSLVPLIRGPRAVGARCRPGPARPCG